MGGGGFGWGGGGRMGGGFYGRGGFGFGGFYPGFFGFGGLGYGLGYGYGYPYYGYGYGYPGLAMVMAIRAMALDTPVMVTVRILDTAMARVITILATRTEPVTSAAYVANPYATPDVPGSDYTYSSAYGTAPLQAASPAAPSSFSLPSLGIDEQKVERRSLAARFRWPAYIPAPPPSAGAASR